MLSFKIFSLVGTAPLAVANALIWHLKTHPDLQKATIFFCATDIDTEKQTIGSRTLINDIINILNGEYTQYFSFLADITLIKDPLIITEAEFTKNIYLLVSKIKELTIREDKIFLDATAGRKIMGASMVTAGYVLKTLGYNVYLLYYWLKLFRPDLLKKPVYELTEDEAESMLINLDDIDKVVKDLRS